MVAAAPSTVSGAAVNKVPDSKVGIFGSRCTYGYSNSYLEPPPLLLLLEFQMLRWAFLVAAAPMAIPTAIGAAPAYALDCHAATQVPDAKVGIFGSRCTFDC